MKRLFIVGFFLAIAAISFGQQKEETKKIQEPVKHEVKQVPKAVQNRAQVKKTQQQRKQIKQAQIKRRQANIAVQRKKAIQRKHK